MKAEWSFVVDVAQSCGVPEAQCEDVAIEVFLRLERHFASMSSSDPPVIRAWLRTTTVHLALEQSSLRATPGGRFGALSSPREGRSGTLGSRPAGPVDPDLMDPAAIVPTPEDQLIAAQTQGSLRSLVDTLEPHRRDVFIAHVIDEEPMTEVARRLGVPEATAYNRLRLARDELREIILRAWKADERKPGGRSFAVLAFLTGAAITPARPLVDVSDMASPAVRQSLPRRDVRWRPQLLLALAASASRRGDPVEAASLLRLYCAEYPEDPLADLHDEVRARLRVGER